MKPLNRDVQSLFERTRGLHEPAPEDKARLRRKLATQIGIGAAAIGTTAHAGATSTIAATATNSVKWAVVKAFLVSAAVGGGAASLAVAVQDQPDSTSSSAVVQPPASKAVKSYRPANSSLPKVVGADAGAAETEMPSSPVGTGTRAANGAVESANFPNARARSPIGPAPRAAAPAAVPPPAVTTTAQAAFPATTDSKQVAHVPAPDPMVPHKVESASASTLRAEARALADAQHALGRGHGERALQLLAEQDRQFVAGALAQERAAARVLALCSVGRRVQARELAERFCAAHPDSPLSTRVCGACEE